MIGIAMGRVALWASRDEQAWMSYCCKWDYYGVIGSIGVATVQVGFEYVWSESRHDLKKGVIGWEWPRWK